MTTYFHCTGAMVAPDSIIEPGNWGRMIRAYLPDEGVTFGTAFREMILESERQAVAPLKPSRLASIFACTSEVELRAFMQGSRRTRDVAYEVEPLSNWPLHFADHNLPLFEPGIPYFDNFATRARSYWTAPPPAQNIEVLIGGPVRVLRRLP